MTPRSGRLCEEVAAASGQTCFLGFSRGKDSVAAWLHLRKYFTRVIPFHCASVPGLSFVDESLDYYERFFGVPILRLMDGDVLAALNQLAFQLPSGEAEIDAAGFWRYSKHEILDLLRREYSSPDAWCAFGINATDSIDRRVYVNKIGGRNAAHKTFYPCFDWSREQILRIVAEHGLKLPRDYLMANRTLAAMPNVRHLIRMQSLLPAELERIELVFPLIRARLARNVFRGGRGAESLEEGRLW